MTGFEILEHTADMGFRVRAAGSEELFANAAAALASITMDTSRAQPLQRHPIHLETGTVEERLVHYLNEVLWLIDGRGIAPARFEPSALWGEPRDPAKHPPRLVVKAVTFHQLRVWQDAEGWGAEVYLDV
jgi:SHS2 domain-containing protein